MTYTNRMHIGKGVREYLPIPRKNRQPSDDASLVVRSRAFLQKRKLRRLSGAETLYLACSFSTSNSPCTAWRKQKRGKNKGIWINKPDKVFLCFCLLTCLAVTRIKVVWGSYQSGMRFGCHRWQEICRHSATKGQSDQGSSRHPAFCSGVSLQSPAAAQLLPWVTSKPHVQTQPRCCKTNSPHRCSYQPGLLHGQNKDWSKEN